MKWDNYSLKEVANYWTGKVDAKVLDSSNYISTDNLISDKGGIVESSYVLKTGKANSYSNKDVLVSNIRPYFKKIWFADKEGGCSNDVLVFRAKEIVEPMYLYYQLSKDAFFDYMVAGSNGTKMPRGNKTSIMEYQLQVPPLSTQRRIASILSAYDDLIENNLRRIKLLEQAARYEYKMLMEGADTESMAMDEICTVSGGGTPSTKDNSYWQGGDIPWFTPTDLTKHNSFVQIDSGKKITEKGLSRSSAKLFPPYTIMMTSRATIGFLSVSSKTACTNQGFINIIPKEEVMRYLLMLNLLGRKEELISNANGSTFLEVPKSNFKKMLIDVPTDNEAITTFHLSTHTKITMIENLLQQNTQLRQARDLLLPKLMSGEIDVEEISGATYIAYESFEGSMAAEDEVPYRQTNK